MKKVGLFLILMGILLLALYLLSDMAGSPRIALLLLGGLQVGAGIWISTATKPPEKPQSTRFKTIREWKKQREQTIDKKKKENNKPRTQR